MGDGGKGGNATAATPAPPGGGATPAPAGGEMTPAPAPAGGVSLLSRFEDLSTSMVEMGGARASFLEKRGEDANSTDANSTEDANSTDVGGWFLRVWFLGDPFLGDCGPRYAGETAALLTTRQLALVAEWLSEQHKTCIEGVRSPPAGHIPIGSAAQGSAGR